jgi:hypothetical protein
MIAWLLIKVNLHFASLSRVPLARVFKLASLRLTHRKCCHILLFIFKVNDFERVKQKKAGKIPAF